MADQNVLDRSTPHSGTAATASSPDDALSEALGNVMLWLIPVLAFLLAILNIR